MKNAYLYLKNGMDIIRISTIDFGISMIMIHIVDMVHFHETKFDKKKLHVK